MTLQKRLKEAKMVAEVISPTMLAVVSTLAVGTGIALKNSDDIYDIGRLFVDYVDRYNDTVGDVLSVFSNSVKVLSNGLISVESPFLDIVKGFFDDIFGTRDEHEITDVAMIETVTGKTYQYFAEVDRSSVAYLSNYPLECKGGKIYAKIGDFETSTGTELTSDTWIGPMSNSVYSNFSKPFNSGLKGSWIFRSYPKRTVGLKQSVLSLDDSPGSYTWDNVIDNKTENGDLPLPIPGDLGNLVGKNPSDVWDKNYENGLVGNGDISIPNVNNPSIGLGGSTSFPVEDNTDGSIDIEYNKTVWSNGDLITADKLNNIEDALEALCTTTENYIKTIWKDNDLITEEKLNKIENAIAVLSPSYEKTNWSNGDIIIAELLNKIENAIEAL